MTMVHDGRQKFDGPGHDIVVGLLGGRTYAQAVKLVSARDAAVLRIAERRIRDLVEHGSEPGLLIHAAELLEKMAIEAEMEGTP